MEWKSQYELGQPLIDSQHRELFRAVNRVADIVNDGDFTRNQRACMEAVKYLKNYTMKHFQDEENYQREIGYGGMDAHTQIHDRFREEILRQERILTDHSFSRDKVLDFVEVLSAWLVNHIMKEDQKITT